MSLVASSFTVTTSCISKGNLCSDVEVDRGTSKSDDAILDGINEFVGVQKIILTYEAIVLAANRLSRAMYDVLASHLYEYKLITTRSSLRPQRQRLENRLSRCQPSKRSFF